MDFLTHARERLLPPAFVCCKTCRVRHRLPEMRKDRWETEAAEFKLRHPGHKVGLRRMVTEDWLRAGMNPKNWRDNANIKEAFGANSQTITCTLASLANSATAARQGTVVDNTSNLYLDALFLLKVKTGASGTSTTGTVNVLGLATVDGGTTYTENAGATDAALTLTNPPNAPSVLIVNAVANATTYYGGPASVARAFNNTLPDHWGIAVQNTSGGALDSTEGNHAKLWQGVYATSI